MYSDYRNAALTIDINDMEIVVRGVRFIDKRLFFEF